MPFAARLVLILPVAFLLYIQGLDQMGLVGPDEPRYAWIGRSMAQSGDWVTPHLYDEPWFEKSPLLYWMTASGFAVGLGNDLAPRLPVALLSVAALGAYFWLLRERWGIRAAAYAVTILGTSAGWLAFSHIGVTDLPLAATFLVAMLLCAEWLETGNPRRLGWAGALLGLALLAKGLVGLVFCAPLFWLGRRYWRDWWRIIAAAMVTGLPWYLLCFARNGRPFWDEFIIKHHVSRFLTPDLAHVQPFWFYVPVLLAGLFPWSFLVVLLRRPRTGTERLLWWWLGIGFLFLSQSMNKLPGYVLPLLPALAGLVGVGLAHTRRFGWPLALSGALVAVIPAIAQILPAAVEFGLRRSNPSLGPLLAMPLGALLVYAMGVWRGRDMALLTAGMLFTTGFVLTKSALLENLDAQVSARQRYFAAGGQAAEICLDDPRRAFRYGANYYAGTVLPDCENQPRPKRITDRVAARH